MSRPCDPGELCMIRHCGMIRVVDLVAMVTAGVFYRLSVTRGSLNWPVGWSAMEWTFTLSW